MKSVCGINPEIKCFCVCHESCHVFKEAQAQGIVTDTRVMYRCEHCGFEWKMELSERPVICPCNGNHEMKLVPAEGLAWQPV